MQRKVICYLIFLMLSALSVYGENATDYFNLGLKSTLTRTKIKYFSKALELAPNLTEAYEKRGMLYFFQGKYDNVIQDFQTYIELSPPKAEAYRMLGMGYLKSGDFPSAIYNFTRAIEIDSKQANAYSNRAEAHFLSGNYDQTILDSTKAIGLDGDPRDIADAYRTRAKAFRKTDRNELSAADIRSSWQIDPRYAYYYRALYGYANPQSMRKAGLIGVIGIAFLLLFKFKLKPPEKDD
ncbi:MAG: tetratricopeptide repeat protein [Desulfobacteraceae bacterium]|jgi:tetratricopeptide (TPR) repeat protein|nr:tetratricopeptide repeat protein [Desulfobacteraceae bacterium]MDH3575124.1 tetratricopeptide repeat protein [Desulfobacteraceae bacterium]MDH3722864.1 tetratricopeptide repeat protein [Desulfobacteraceae bacterium]MDH3838930.1 tetratricopeptide repeat protein [Desulfobacteraceae bacterium]